MATYEPCVSPKDVAAMLAIGERTATRLMQTGAIEAFKLRGKLWRTTPAKVAAYQKREFGRWREATGLSGLG